MDRATAINKVKAYAQTVSANYNADRIILFGSFASNTSHADSDIDVAVIFAHFPEDYLTLATKLHKLTRTIDLRIEPVAFQINDESDLSREITEKGIVIYDKHHKIYQ